MGAERERAEEGWEGERESGGEKGVGVEQRERERERERERLAGPMDVTHQRFLPHFFVS